MLIIVSGLKHENVCLLNHLMAVLTESALWSTTLASVGLWHPCNDGLLMGEFRSETHGGMQLLLRGWKLWHQCCQCIRVDQMCFLLSCSDVKLLNVVNINSFFKNLQLMSSILIEQIHVCMWRVPLHAPVFDFAPS